jgi:hypothetical protein
MSELSDKAYNLLKELFPYNVILKEHYVNYKGNRLFFDFYIKDLGILFEIQGRQHKEFVEHFHQDRAGFFESKKRDSLKIEYTETNKIPFVEINYDEKINKNMLLRKIIKAQSEALKNDRNNNER